MKHLRLTAAIAILAAWSGLAAAAPISIVVAENFYAEPVRAIGGDNVTVTEIISGPNADPHDFEPTPSTARAIADAAIVIYNGLAYDPWMDKLLAASKSPKRVVISVAALLKRQPGDNPHLWYDPQAMPALTDAVAKALAAVDPAGAVGYASRAAAYKSELGAVSARIAAVKAKHAGAPVTATEPVFGYMAEALGLDMRNKPFQRAIMNETEPSGRDTVAMEADLKDAKVRVLFYNTQVTDEVTRHLLALATAGKVPVVGVTETKPADQTYVQWMINQIDATEKALAAPRG